ncbi:MAG: aminotransferase class I/II-fold pyridoxal phosphate-dependent enzyme [Promethearchaeota archaeon]
MKIGEPEFDTPFKIISHCFSEIKQGKTHHTDSLGYLELREAISEYKHKKRGTRYNPQMEIMVTVGTSHAFFNVISTITNPGDEIIIHYRHLKICWRSNKI